jgi:putative RecB family exonuclease
MLYFHICYMTVYSHSRLSCFEQCPMKFKLKYIDKVQTEVQESIEAFLGKRVHETLEKLYMDLKFQKIPTLNQLLAYYLEIWKKHWNSSIIITRKDYTETNYKTMGKKFIEDYYKKFHPFNQATVLGLETKISLSLDKNGNYKLIGFIDRLDYCGKGVYEVHDYKTNANLPLQTYLDRDRQLALYSIAIKNMHKDAKKVRLVWHFLAFNKTLTSYRTDTQLENLKKNTIELIKKIEKEKEFKPKTSKLCDWCEFKSMCKMWAHLYKVEQLPFEKFKKDDGVKLVNELADLSAKEKEIGLKIQIIKDKIIMYGKQIGVSVVFGSDAKATIKEYESLKVPAKDTRERIALEKLIHQYNKWLEVSTLDSFSLKRILKQERWPKDLANKTRKLLKEELTHQVRMGKFKGGD